MDKLENKQRMKNEALNKIRKIYDVNHKFTYDEYDGASCAEQRECSIEYIIQELESNIKAL